jgi:accessory gene regulator protein AgrB
MNRKVNLLRSLVWFLLGLDVIVIYPYTIINDLTNPLLIYAFALFAFFIIVDMNLWKYQKKVDGE